MKTIFTSSTRRIFFLSIGIIASLLLIKTAFTSRQIARPVSSGDEPVNSNYLYGEGTAIHKGLDWSNVTLGDSVYAIADGTVVDMYESHPNGCAPNDPHNFCNAYGNYVLIRHSITHYDRSAGTLAWVYSLYLHLKQNSVGVNVNDSISQGQLIAQGDDTGNSSGHHLHLQIILHPDSNRVLANINSENRTRNPELWINSLANKATLVGRISNTSGNPIGSRYVHGLQKNGWSGTLFTYPSAVNPDEYYSENFATTDINPGT